MTGIGNVVVVVVVAVSFFGDRCRCRRRSAWIVVVRRTRQRVVRRRSIPSRTLPPRPTAAPRNHRLVGGGGSGSGCSASSRSGVEHHCWLRVIPCFWESSSSSLSSLYPDSSRRSDGLICLYFLIYVLCELQFAVVLVSC